MQRSAVVVALDSVISAEIATAARRDPVAARLLAPYLAWSLYATALTAAARDPDTDPSRGTPRRWNRRLRRT